MRQDACWYAVPLTICLGMSPVALAELEPISDREMSQVQGQAMMTVDHVDGVNHRFTRVTLGVDAEIRLNADGVVMGGDDSGADLDIKNFALGHYVRDDTRVQVDGNTYNVDDVVPFEGVEPYLELAEREGQLSGFRFGLNQARGTLSGEIASFSGNLNLKINDADGNPVDAMLFDDAGVATNHRATQIGLAGEDGTCVVVLDGRGSYDPQNQIVTWSWHDQTGRELAASSQLKLKLPVGQHRFELRVVDRQGAWTTDALVIHIVDGSTS